MREISDNGKMWAILSYAGMFTGLPIGLVPLVMRDDPYAVEHARHAVGNFVGMTIAVLLVMVLMMPVTMCTFGFGAFLLFPLLMPLVVWPIVTNLHGIALVANEEWVEPIGGFGIGNALFGSIVAKDSDIIDVPG